MDNYICKREYLPCAKHHSNILNILFLILLKMDTETILGLATSNRRQLDLGQENWRGNYKDTGVGNRVQG